MSFEALKAEIDLLLQTMTDTPHDSFELYVQLKEKINELRAFGMPPPADLVELEQALDREFSHRGSGLPPSAS